MNPVLDLNSATGLFNPYKFSIETVFNGKPFTIKYSKRAKQALRNRTTPLIVEMQIYFSCMVQKRVLFHDSYDSDLTSVNDEIAIVLRIVQSDRCDPVTYARSHPEKRELTSKGAKKMSAKELIIDYKNDDWIGNFKIG